MIQINLLPIEKRQKVRVAQQNLGFLLFSCSMLIILTIIIIVLLALKYTFKANLDNLQNNLKTAQQSLDSYQEVKEETLFIKDRLQELEKLQGQKTAWWQNLQSLAQVVPQTIQLTSLTINSKTKPEVKISGLATSRLEIIKFKEQLEVSPFYQDIIFESSQKTSQNDKKYYDFTLWASLEK